MINKINNLIDELINNGSNIEDSRDYLLTKSLDVLENNNYQQFINDLKIFIESNLNKETGIKNISVGIKIKNCELIFNSGNVDFENIVYDIASITKLFTLKLCYEFNKMDILDYNQKVIDIDSSFKALDSYKIIDILKMQGFIETKGKLSECNNKKEFYERLKTVKIKDYNKSLYTDIGFNILPTLLEKIYEQQFNEFVPFDQLCEKYIFKPYNLLNTGFNLTHKKIIGNDYGDLPSDKKAKILNGVSGAAGICTTLEDMLKLTNYLNNYTFFDKKFINEIMNYYFLDDLDRKRSYSGIYLYTDNNRKSYVPIYYSTNTLGHQGYTGSVIVCDLKNNINQVILVDALNKNNKKEEEFFKAFHLLQERISLDSLVLYIVNSIKDVK